MAPCGPSPAMVAKDSSLKPAWAARNAETFSPMAYSSCTSPAATARSSQHQKDAMATPSRKCASSMPASSVGFLMAFAMGMGLTPSLIVLAAGAAAAAAAAASGAEVSSFFFAALPARGSAGSLPTSSPAAAASSAAATSDALTLSGSTQSRAPLAAAPRMSASHASYGFTSTPASRRCAATSGVILPASTYNAAVSRPTRPNASDTGLYARSPPRTLNNHATSSRGLTTR
mmetsp:Transcript_10324/g.16517  ORF Transcript_10324/g.16517 Transcript_10324/m.16517 type:complete len:231 (+) Transcript_10324:1302-1994(+)